MNAASAWQYPQAALTGVLAQQQPFRDNSLPDTTLAFLPDDDGETLILQRIEEDKAKRGNDLYIPIEDSQRHDVALEPGPRIGPWGEFDLMALLAELAAHLDLSLEDCAKRFATVEVPQSTQGWRYHPCLGFGIKR